MKSTLLYFLILFSLFAKGQLINTHPLWPYFSITPLTKTYKGEKIKRVLFQEATGKVVIITKGSNLTLSEQKAIEEKIIPMRPKPPVVISDTSYIAGQINHINIFTEDPHDIVSSYDTYMAPTKNKYEYKFNVPVPKTISIFIADSMTSIIKKIIKCNVVSGSNDTASNNSEIYFTDDKSIVIDYRAFKDQKTFKLSGGYSFSSAVIYFSGTSFENVYTNSVDKTTIDKDQYMIDVLLPGSVITFDNVKVKDNKGNETAIEGRSFVLIDSADPRTNYVPCRMRPEFPGGNVALLNYIKKTIEITADDLADKKQYLFFNIKILEDGTALEMPVYNHLNKIEQKIIHALENGPKWMASTFKGEPVTSLFSVQFSWDEILK